MAGADPAGGGELPGLRAPAGSRPHIAALGLIKAIAAEVNAELGVLDKELAQAIAEAATDVAENEYDGEFPVDVFQTGSGTSSNMNANEVIATLAEERLGRPVHPNDHVNASQSSNDVFPTSIHVAAMTEVTYHLIPRCEHLATALRNKSLQFEEVVKAGRTHLMDATPVTLGQEFGGYATQIEHGDLPGRSSLPHCPAPAGRHGGRHRHQHPAGLRPQGHREAREATGLAFSEAPDHFEAQGARDAIVELSGQLSWSRSPQQDRQ